MYNHHSIKKPALYLTTIIALNKHQFLLHQKLSYFLVLENRHRGEKFLLFFQVEEVVMEVHQAVVVDVYVVEELGRLQQGFVVAVGFQSFF